jgi:hypothetical protein
MTSVERIISMSEETNVIQGNFGESEPEPVVQEQNINMMVLISILSEVEITGLHYRTATETEKPCVYFLVESKDLVFKVHEDAAKRANEYIKSFNHEVVWMDSSDGTLPQDEVEKYDPELLQKILPSDITEEEGILLLNGQYDYAQARGVLGRTYQVIYKIITPPHLLKATRQWALEKLSENSDESLHNILASDDGIEASSWSFKPEIVTLSEVTMADLGKLSGPIRETVMGFIHGPFTEILRKNKHLEDNEGLSIVLDELDARILMIIDLYMMYKTVMNQMQNADNSKKVVTPSDLGLR